ncbi:MAG: hypothetical protein Q9217_003842 [Psora testacea]
MRKQKPVKNTAPTPPDVSIFLRNLRLLNLDKCDDWPSISTLTLTRKDAGPNQKARIHLVEWALYRLFEIWSPETTQNVSDVLFRGTLFLTLTRDLQKLQPFFPPLDPLQSLNLRAALFRCLEQLRQDGTLSKEVIVRKTMFDECKGEKFFDLLGAFSTVVLRKVLAEDETGKQSIAGRLCLAEKDELREHASFLPLALAHRVALKGVLRRKEQLRARYRNFGSLLDEKDRELEQKFEKIVGIQGFLDQNIAPEATVSRVAKQFDQHWQGDRRFINVIAQGEGSAMKDELLDESFGKHWLAVGKGTIISNTSTSPHGLLDDLERRVAAQKDRLQLWIGFKSDVQKDLQPVYRSQRQDLFSPRGKGATLELLREKELVFSPRKSPRKSEGPMKSRSDEQCPSAPLAKVLAPGYPTTDSDRAHEDRPRNTRSLMTWGVPSKVTETIQLPKEQHANGKESGYTNDEDQLAEHILSMALNATPKPIKLPVSLSERTRQSMAFASPGARLPANEPTSKPSVYSQDPSHRAADGSSIVKGNLLERTRQSISLVPAQSRGSRKSTHNRSSKNYPTNQFETPRKQNLVTELTPPEELFSPGAGYDSVFKSRPKVTFSPTASPAPVFDGVDRTDRIGDGASIEESPLARLAAQA